MVEAQLQSVVVGNILTLGVLAVVAATCWLFEPYLGWLFWGQLFAMALRGPRDRLRREKEPVDKAASRLMGYLVVGGLGLTVFAAAGLTHDVALAGSTLNAAARTAGEAPGWLAVKLEPIVAEIRPKVAEKASPFLTGLGANETCCALKIDSILEKANLGDMEPTARKVLLAVDGLLQSGEVDNLDDLKSEASARFDELKKAFQNDDSLKEKGKAVAQQAAGVFGQGLGIVVKVCTKLAGFVTSSISGLIGAILFFVAVFAQLRNETDYLSAGALAMAPNADHELRSLSVAAEALLVAPVFRAVAFSSTTFFLLLLTGGRAKTTAASLAYVSGLLYPFLPCAAVSAIWAFFMATQASSTSYLRALAFLLAHILLISKIATYFDSALAQHLRLPLSVVRLAYVLGLQRLGTKGLVLGPLLLALATVAFRLLAQTSAEVMENDDDDDRAGTTTVVLDDPSSASFLSPGNKLASKDAASGDADVSTADKAAGTVLPGAKDAASGDADVSTADKAAGTVLPGAKDAASGGDAHALLQTSDAATGEGAVATVTSRAVGAPPQTNGANGARAPAPAPPTTAPAPAPAAARTAPAPAPSPATKKKKIGGFLGGFSGNNKKK